MAPSSTGRPKAGAPTAGATRPGLSGLVAGARGATVLLYEDAFAFAAPGARLLERPGAVEDLCLSPDGEQLLVDLGEELLLLRTRDGQELRRWPGPRSLVGFNPAALSLDLSTGLVEDEAGAPIYAGFRPWSAAAAGPRVYGPEGAAWCLQTGQPLWSHAGLEAEALVADAAQIIALREGVLSRLHPDGHDLGGGPLPEVLVDDDALHLRALAGGRLWWTGTRAAWSTNVDGGDLQEVDEATLPAERPAGATIQAGGRTWTWTADGLLLALQA